MTASILAVLGAAGGVSSGLHRLISLRRVPDVILALNNEISYFQLLLRMTSELLQESGPNIQESSSTSMQNLRPILIRAKEKLFELDLLILSGLTSAGDNRECAVNKVFWVREHKRVKELQDEIRSIRINLVAAVGVLTAKSTLRIERQVSQLCFINNELQRQSQAQRAIDQALASQEGTDQKLQNILVTQEGTSHQLHRLLNPAVRGQMLSVKEKLSQWSFQIFVRRPQLSSCDTGCACSCHRRSEWASASRFRTFLGLLFIGYTGKPMGNKCDDIRCQQIPETVIGLRYFFPDWFMARMLEIYVRVSKPFGLTQTIRVSSVIWYDSRLFQAARDGDVLSIKALLSSREASPYDVLFEGGDTALMVSNS